ncbi:MAG: T9SS type A sorting domain-containing protein [Bacteroidota bacterium]
MSAKAQWTEQTSGTTDDLYSVYFTDDDTGYAVGENGTILETSDGGSNWEEQESGTTDDLHSVYFIDDDMGYAVGSDGTILETTSGIGISEFNKEKNNFIIYPNPATDNLTIESPQQAVMEISSIQGQLIKTLATNGNKTSIDISALPNGMYFIKMKTEKGIAVKKFVKE